MTDGGLFAVIHHAFKSYARQGLLGALLSKINPDTCKVYTGHRLRHYTVTPESKIKLHFGYDTPTTCDILIGADGIHSRVRYMMYDSTPEHAKPVFGGQCAYRMVVSADGLRKKDANNACLTGFNMVGGSLFDDWMILIANTAAPGKWSGKGRHFVTTAIGPKIYVTAYENVPSHEPIERTKDWVKSASPKKILSLAEGWEPDLVNLLKESAIPDDQGNRATRWAVHVIPPIPTFSSGPIAVIGDAAHAMLPHQGLGACTGIEDAFVLAKLLQSPLATKVTLTKVLQAFDSVRRPQAQAAVRGSEVSGKIFDLEHESQIGKSLEEIGHEIAQVGEWLTVDSGCEDSAEEAVEVLSELCRTTPYALPPAISHLDSVNGKGIDEVTTVSLRDVESYRKPES